MRRHPASVRATALRVPTLALTLGLTLGALSPSIAAAGTASSTAKVKPATPFCGTGAVNCSDPPMAGALTPTSARIWVHLSATADASIRYRPAKTVAWTQTATQAPTIDITDPAAAQVIPLKFTLTALLPDTAYQYQIGIRQPDGTRPWSTSLFLRTPPAAPTQLAFSVLTDFSNKLAGSAALRSATAVHNDFVLAIGDMDHRAPAADPLGQPFPPNDPPVLTAMRSMHGNMRHPDWAIGADFYQGLLTGANEKKPQVPLYYVWDDHDYCMNNATSECAQAAFAFRAYDEYYLWAADSGMNTAGSGCARQGVWQHLTIGTLADVIMLDARSSRVDPGTGGPGTMLGECQLGWLLQALQNARGTWKFLVSPVPFNPLTKSWDAWGMFPEERDRVLAQVATLGIRNLIVLSGDIHSGGAYDDGSHCGLPEFSVPHANMPDSWVDTACPSKQRCEPGSWTLGTLAPPRLDVTLPPGPYPLPGTGQPGYVRVEADSLKATVQVMDATGAPRMAVRADGTTVPLSVTFTAQ